MPPLTLALFATGCASIDPVGTQTNALSSGVQDPDEINWPAQYAPERSTFYLRNELLIDASAQEIWDVLVRAETWPDWYEGAKDVVVLESDSGTIDNVGTEISWSTMGQDFNSIVTEFEPPYRLAWESRKKTIKAYHAWLLIPGDEGTLVVTEESQFGFLANMQKIFLPNKLSRLHDIWLEEIKKKAEADS